MFEALFKYRPALFREADLAFIAPRTLTVIAVLLALVLVVLAVRYRPSPEQASGLDRAVLLTLRLCVIALLLFCLLQPSLVLSTLVPQETFVGVLVDDSKSMLIEDGAESSRAGQVLDVLAGQDDSAWGRLQERFRVRLFGFSDSVGRIEGAGDLTFAGGETRLGPALDRAAEELSGIPLAGLVLFSDGADTGDESFSDVLLSLKARGVPVHTVGLGRERFDRDIEVRRVVAPRQALLGSSLLVEVTVNQRGYSGESVRLEVEDGGRIVNVQEIEFPTDGEAVTAQVEFMVAEAGPRVFRFRIDPRENEQVSQNNEQSALIEVLDRREKILYFEGEPRFEVKFLRRAVADDKNLQLVVLQRTAENKFLRLDVDDPLELQGGFPTRREELFQYRGIILGSVEASFFTYDQMRMMVDFVSERGGGLMVLGGRRALSEGGYAGTPLEDVLPVVLEAAPPEGSEPYFSRLRVEPTAQGRAHPALRLADDDDGSLERWKTLPPLSTFNPVAKLKPGATALLIGKLEGGEGDDRSVLAFQRYGRGRALALSVHDTWMWQMHHEIPLEDQTHERLWRQMLRWLVSYVPDSVVVESSRDRVAPGDSVTLEADVRDPGFLAVNRAEVTATVRSPSGEEREVPLEWSVERDGVFRGNVETTEPGLHRVEIEAISEGEDLGSAAASFQVTELEDEFFGAERRTSLLERVSTETGGRNYELDELDELVEDLAFSEGGSTMREYRDLWDMPILLVMLLLLLGSEWIYRRWRGLA